MPGPGGRKTKSKPKYPAQTPANSSNSLVVPDAFLGDIDNAEGWSMIVSILCDALDLPDLSTRSGLKKVHANFDSIYRRIDKVYQRNANNERIRGGIVGIYAKMSVDSILRNKLFERGILDKLMPLIGIQSTRHLALRALGTITHHGGAHIRVEIAKHANALTKLMQEHPEDDKVAELSVTTLAHSVVAVCEGGAAPANPKVLSSLDMPTILQEVLKAVKRPASTSYTLDHAVELFAMGTLHASAAYKAYPPAVNLLVAGLRSKDWVIRCTCLGGLIRLHRHEAEDDQRGLDPNIFIGAIQRGFPGHLSDVLMAYGPTDCDIYLTLQTSTDFQKAMVACAQNKDLYRLGLKLAEFILRTEFSISDGMFQFLDERTGKYETADVGLPFAMYAESLPHCAKAIRQRKKPNEEDMADILDIKYRIMKQRLPDAVDLAKKALLRNPNGAYFYYAITLSADNVQGLRAAKKGLKCKDITPFVRFQLMQRAVEHAGDMGIRLLQDSPRSGDHKWEEGIAFLMSALEDSKTYVEQAPPDNRHMKNVSYWNILLTITIKEHLSPDLSEMQGALKRLEIADEFSTFIGVPPPKTNLRLAQQSVVRLFPKAMEEFSNIISRNEVEVEKPVISPGKLEDDLAAWLDGISLDGTNGEEQETHCMHPKITDSTVALYRCSWCGNPSAALRKCSRCSKTRYCDSGCQKAQWSEHKRNCTT